KGKKGHSFVTAPVTRAFATPVVPFLFSLKSDATLPFLPTPFRIQLDALFGRRERASWGHAAAQQLTPLSSTRATQRR
ncbi:MAG: hypothetical protein P8Y94_09225, partial [Acidobacteriota bacterium]